MGNPARNTEHLIPWKPGQSGNPAGRPRGARAKLTESVIKKLLASFELHGDAAIERVRINQPAAYLAACVSLLPKQQEKIESPFADLTEDELDLLEHFLKSTRAKTVTTIDADATHLPDSDADAIAQDARERAAAEPVAEPPRQQQHFDTSAVARAQKAERQRARAAARTDLTALSDAEIEQRLDAALNSPKRDTA